MEAVQVGGGRFGGFERVESRELGLGLPFTSSAEGLTAIFLLLLLLLRLLPLLPSFQRQF